MVALLGGGHHLVDLFEVAAQAVVVEAVAHHELVGDGESYVIQGQGMLGGFGLVQQGRDL